MSGNNIGKLSVVSTPIGNLEDITYRAVRILSEADIIIAEDTRKASIIFDKFNIEKKRIFSHHVHNEHKNAEHLTNKILEGKNLALISEAGTPCISDPGFLIIREALKNNIEPEVIPGVSALSFAAVASGLPTETFVFYGFLPPKKTKRAKILKEISESEKTAFIFESPKKIKRLLEEISENIGGECGVSLIREATKINEEVLRGKCADIFKQIQDKNLKGEIVIGISSRYIPNY